MCLDVGAGQGTVAAFLAGSRETVAVDKDTRLLDQLMGCDGLEVVEADVTDGDALSRLGWFDLVHARFLLMHLRDRQAVLASLSERLRAGGSIIVSDSIDLTPGSKNPVGEVMAAMWRVLETTIGTDISQPLWIADWLKRHGFGQVTTEVFLPSAHGGAPISWFWKLTWEQLRDHLTPMVGTDIFNQALADLSTPEFTAISPGMITTTAVKL